MSIFLFAFVDESMLKYERVWLWN